MNENSRIKDALVNCKRSTCTKCPLHDDCFDWEEDGYIGVPPQLLEEAIARLGAYEALFNLLPRADVVPVIHARWRPLEDGSLECTNCHGENPPEENYYGDVIWTRRTEYCPTCGARMDKEEDEE